MVAVTVAEQRTHGFQVVAIADPKQMQSVEAGGVVELLRRGLGEKAIPTLATSVRQVTERLSALSSGLLKRIRTDSGCAQPIVARV